MKKTIIKFLILGILIFGIYQAPKVKPVEVKRTAQAEENFKTAQSFNFSTTISLESSREGYYDLELEGYKNKEKAKGDFNLSTELNNQAEDITGEFVYSEGFLYFNFDQDGLPRSLENLFQDNYNLTAREANQEWIKVEFNEEIFNTQFLTENIEVISEEENVNEKEMYYYKSALRFDYLSEDALEAELFLGEEDLNVYKIVVDDELTLSKDLEFDKPFQGFSTGSSPTLKIKAEFSNFKSQEEIEIPTSPIEL